MTSTRSRFGILRIRSSPSSSRFALATPHGVTYQLTNLSPAYREDIPALSLIATQTPRPDPKKATSSPDFTAIILTLLRLEKESTDVLITINVPHIKGEYDEDEVDLELGKQGQLIGDAVEYAARIWGSFQVKDWNLFNEV